MSDQEFLRRWMERGFDDPIWYPAVLAESRYEGGQVTEIRLHPVELGYERTGPKRGTPRLAPPQVGRKILENLQRLSEPYGTEIRIEDGVGVIGVAAQVTASAGGLR